MKQKIEAAFSKLPEAVQVAIYGSYRDIMAACDTHPNLAPAMLEKLNLPPEFDAMRSALADIRKNLLE
jgi:hypothetical protein